MTTTFEVSPWPARIACVVAAGVVATGSAFAALSIDPSSIMARFDARDPWLATFVLPPLALLVPAHRLGWLKHTRALRAPGHLWVWIAVVASFAGVMPIAAFTLQLMLDREDALFPSARAEAAALSLDRAPLLEGAGGDEPGWCEITGTITGQGVVLIERDGAWHVDSLQLGLDASMRASSDADLAWLALVDRSTTRDAYRSAMRSIDVEHLDLTIVDRAGAAVARASCEAVPPEVVDARSLRDVYFLRGAFVAGHLLTHAGR